MSKNIIKRWKLHSKIAVIMLFVLALFPFFTFSMWAFYPGYVAGAFLFRLHRFFGEKREKLILMHTVLMIVFWITAFLSSHLRRKPLYFVLFLTLTYIIWMYFADWWMKEQVSPSGTVLIGNVVNQWPDLFNVVGTKTEEDVIGFVELYRVPIVLTGHSLDPLVMDQLSKIGVIVVVSGYKTTFPRYEELEFIMPNF